MGLVPAQSGGDTQHQKDLLIGYDSPEAQGAFSALCASELNAAEPSSSDSLVAMQASTLEHMRRFAAGGYLYAILDATDQPEVPKKAAELTEANAVSLFKGTAQEDYWACAPDLVKVDGRALDWLVTCLWREPWGIFVLSKTDLETLRNHFRRFLVAQLPDGNNYFFRFYDPRNLKAILESFSPEELKEFFGEARGFAVGERDQVRIYSPR